MLQQEIERKFLVNGSYKDFATSSMYIEQGYLNSHSERTVRVRISNNEAWLTIKGKSNESGLSRIEWEKEIEHTEAKVLLSLCEPNTIEKTRYLVPAGGHTFEVDEFYGNNAGLVLAEIELKSETDLFAKPDWLGKEVTGDVKYYNASLLKKPFNQW